MEMTRLELNTLDYPVDRGGINRSDHLQHIFQKPVDELDPTENTSEPTDQPASEVDNTQPLLNGDDANEGPHDNKMTPEEQHLHHHDTHSVPDELPPHSPHHVINVQPIIVEEEGEGDEEVVVEDVSPSEGEEVSCSCYGNMISIATM